MSELERLIQELCPNGVLFKTIDELCDVFTGGEAPPDCVKGKLADDVCKYPVYSNGINENAIYGYSASYVIDRTGVTFSSIGTIGHPTIREAKFTPIIRLKVIIPKNDNVLSVGFLKYALEVVDFTQNKSSVPNVNAKQIKAIKIPVPPIEVQGEIVRILDNFTELTAELTEELTEELTARKKQYEYYRDELLNNAKNARPLALGDIAKIKNGRDYKSLNSGTIPVYGSGGIMTYVDEYAYNKPTVLIPRKGSVDKLYYVETPFWNVDTIFYTDINVDVVIPKYLFYLLQKEHLEQYNTAGGVPSLTQGVLNKVSLLVPSIDEQKRIVDILDRFDTLCNDISAALPAEIEARQKQYEHYRNLLLKF